MTIEGLLPRLQAVRRTSRGYVARCPAHADKSPSLSIRETDDKILLHCHAGCKPTSICEAVGLSLKDLFTGSAIDPCDIARHRAQRARQRREHEQRCEAEGRTLDACKYAQRFIDSRRSLDISEWPNEELDVELNALADAYALLESEEL